MQPNTRNSLLVVGIGAAVIAAIVLLVMRKGDVSDMPVTTGQNPEPGSLVHDLPIPDAVAKAREHLADELGIAQPSDIVIMEAPAIEWPDSCLGLPAAGEACARVITPGYRVVMLVGGIVYVYRTNADGSVLRTEPLELGKG